MWGNDIHVYLILNEWLILNEIKTFYNKKKGYRLEIRKETQDYVYAQAEIAKE